MIVRSGRLGWRANSAPSPDEAPADIEALRSRHDSAVLVHRRNRQALEKSQGSTSAAMQNAVIIPTTIDARVSGNAPTARARNR